MENKENTGNIKTTNEIMPSVLKLMRAMRRRPMNTEHDFPPSVERMLITLNKNDGESPARLCELMDVRPSSMSELLSGMERHGLITREENEEDRRATRVFLSAEGKEAVQKIAEKAAENNAKLSECFTEEELAVFCELCDKLSAHLESLPKEGCCGGHRGHRGHHGPHCHHGHFGPHGPRCHHGHFGRCGGHRHIEDPVSAE